MKQLNIIAVAAVALLASTSAMALRAPEADAVRSRPAANVIGTIFDRDAHRDAKEIDKRERKQAKELRKQAHEREKEIRKAERKRAKDARVSAKRDQKR